jgi:hypothetical protein
MRVIDQLQTSAALPSGKEPLTADSEGGWMGPRHSLDVLEKRKSLVTARNQTIIP